MSDPNGWVTSPPSTMVKIHSLSARPALNGAYGIVLQYATDRQRYIVHMATTGDQVSLKANNLIIVTWWERMIVQYQLLRHDRTVQQQVSTLYRRLQTATGLSQPEYLAIPLVLVLVVAVYFIGFSRSLLILTTLLLLFTLVAEDLGQPVSVMVRNIPRRFQAMIRQQVPVVGPKIADSNILSASVAGLFILFLGKSILVSNKSTRPSPTFAPAETTRRASSLLLSRDEYYKLGFDDATAHRPYGTSLPTTDTVVEDDTASFDFSYSHMPPPKPSPWNVGTAMSLMYIALSIGPLLRDPVTGQLSLQALKQNASTLPPWRMLTLCIGVYKVVQAFL